MEHIVDSILGLGGLAAYVVVGLLAFGKAAAFVGLMLPGEIAVLLGGVLASQGRVSPLVMLAVAAASAVAGDSAGYEIGRRWGPRLMNSRITRRNNATIREAHEYMIRRGGLMVFVGRWTSVLRAIVPAVAGMTRMPYRRFFAFNLVGGVAWAAAFTLAGYVAGESYARVEAATDWGSWMAGGVLVAWIAARFAMRRWRARTQDVLPPTYDGDATDPAQDETYSYSVQSRSGRVI